MKKRRVYCLVPAEPANDILDIKEANHLETESLAKGLFFTIIFLSPQVVKTGGKALS